jgi:hypothetical protein
VLDELFAEAWVNGTHRVLGLKLRPFSLWHRLQLEILDSPLLKGEVPLPLDLERACRACQLVYPQVVPTQIKWWSLRWRLAGRDYEEEIKKMGAYLSDYYSPPQFLPPIKKYHRTDVTHPPPENMRIFSAVVALTGWPEERIWNLPIGQAYWYAAGHWYQQGQELDFLTPEHLVLKQRIDAMKKGKSNGSE